MSSWKSTVGVDRLTLGPGGSGEVDPFVAPRKGGLELEPIGVLGSTPVATTVSRVPHGRLASHSCIVPLVLENPSVEAAVSWTSPSMLQVGQRRWTKATQASGSGARWLGCLPIAGRQRSLGLRFWLTQRGRDGARSCPARVREHWGRVQGPATGGDRELGTVAAMNRRPSGADRECGGTGGSLA